MLGLALGARQAGSPSHRLNLRLGAVALATSQHQTDPFLGTEKYPSLGSSGSLGEGHNPQHLAKERGHPYIDSLPFIPHPASRLPGEPIIDNSKLPFRRVHRRKARPLGQSVNAKGIFLDTF